MMVDYYEAKAWENLMRSQLCSAGVAFGLHAMWRSPRDAFRHGGLQYGLVLTLLMLFVALPVALLQIGVGRLSQQDAVGIWKAVPFFKGIGYIKLMISVTISIYTVIYVSLTIIYFIHGISQSLPFVECSDLFASDPSDWINASACLEETYMASYSKHPEYFLNVSFIALFLWIILPLIFYNPVKLMKRVMYALGPIVITLSLVTAFCIGNSDNLISLWEYDWGTFSEPYIWHAALVQALLSSQVAGGYLLSAGDAIYSNTDIQLSAWLYIGMNILSTWTGLLFWYSVTVSGEDRDTTVFAVLIETYKIGEQVSTNVEWPILIFFILILSGFLSLLTILFPIYDHCRHIAGLRWRIWSMSGSLGCAVVTVGVLALRAPFITLLEDYAVPLLISISIIPEILALLLVYDWRIILQDIEFLVGHDVCKVWAIGMALTPLLLAPVTAWWFTTIYVYDNDWIAAPRPTITLVVFLTIAVLIFLIFAAVVIARQVQFDFIGKLKSSFKPSRHWGPRDPVTHYYWLARKQDIERGHNSINSREPSSYSFPKYLNSNYSSKHSYKKSHFNAENGTVIQHRINSTELPEIRLSKHDELDRSNSSLEKLKNAVNIVGLPQSNMLSLCDNIGNNNNF